MSDRGGSEIDWVCSLTSSISQQGQPHFNVDRDIQIPELMRTYALLEDGDEPGAEDARFQAVDIDYERGSATGYIVKYILQEY